MSGFFWMVRTTCVDLGVERWVVISMVVMCNIIIIEHDGRNPGLPNAPIIIEDDNKGINI